MHLALRLDIRFRHKKHEAVGLLQYLGRLSRYGDYFVQRQTSPQLAPSILCDASISKAKVKFGALSWAGFALLLIGSGFISEVRILASLMMGAACLLIFDCYKRSHS
jgi:hypothetical protein